MLAHGRIGGLLVACIDCGHNCAMLVDQGEHRFGAREGKLTDPVHMSLDVLDRLPGKWAAGTFSKRDMEELVVSLKGSMVIPSRRLLLHLKEVFDSLPALTVKGQASPPDDRGLDCLTDKARLHHLFDRDLHHNRAALRLNLD